MYSLHELNEAYIKENFSSSQEAVGTILGLSIAIFVLLVILSILLPIWALYALIKKQKELTNFVKSVSIILILGIFVPGIGFYGPILALIMIYTSSAFIKEKI